MLVKTTLTQRNLSVSNLSYSLNSNTLITELNTTPHNLQGSIPITVSGVVSLETEFDSSILNGLKIFEVITPTKLRTSTTLISSLNFPLKLATGSINANVNQLTLLIDIKNQEDSTLIYTLQDGYILDGATINYKLKLLNDQIGSTTSLFGIPTGILSNLKQGMLIEFTVVNSTINTNIPIVIQI